MSRPPFIFPTPLGPWVAALVALLAMSSCQSRGGRGAGAETDTTGSTAMPGSVPAPVSRRAPQTFVYECDGDTAITVRVEGDTAWVFSPRGTVALPRVRSASGTKYALDDDLYWNKGAEAFLQLHGRTYTGCVNNPREAVWEDAKLDGVDFRALGQEPGWLLEITRGRNIVLEADYGENRYVFPAAEPEVDAASGRMRYVTALPDHRLEVLIESEPCRDIMSGFPFPSTVTITLDGRTLRGCGRALH